ncbi:hypothetical protein [Arthrobacter globiformis]|uniref:hypothetical protein n=1 Tax=Arthrobacter globiformis TaxID=1665 RepID=UPI002782FD79|nr:hypothetical protein [Arthrobacter globiformis]MDQ0867281.1 hypothetical protein [Arthrobacter globiformis]
MKPVGKGARLDLNVLGELHKLTPFLLFCGVYAKQMYPGKKTTAKRIAQFKKDHPFAFKVLWALDLLVQIAAVASVMGTVGLVVVRALLNLTMT